MSTGTSPRCGTASRRSSPSATPSCAATAGSRWAEFDDRATRLAWHLEAEAGVAPGDRIAIELTNRPEYLETFYAALKLGCVPVNVNFRYTATELHYLLDNSDAKAVVHGAEFTKSVAGGGEAHRRAVAAVAARGG